MSSPFQNQTKAFHDRAIELEAWAFQRLVNRYDRLNFYNPRKQRSERGATYSWPKSREGANDNVLPLPQNDDFNFQYIRKHFLYDSKDDRGNIVALPSTSRDNTCKWLGYDIDNHRQSDPELAARNFEVALEIWRRLEDKGLRCLLEDSNGDGGFHLWCFFSDPVPTRDLHVFGSSIKEGLSIDPEMFPKQPHIGPGQFGNVLRIPGVHHTKNHVSRFWNGTQWLEGTAAVEYLLGSPVNDAGLIPTAPPPAPRPPKFQDDTPCDLKDLKAALDALPSEYCDRYDLWAKVMLALAREARRWLGENEDAIYELALEFSEAWDSPTKLFDQERFESQWSQFLATVDNDNGDTTGKITVGSIFKWAMDAGWQRPAKPYVPFRIPIRRGRMMAHSDFNKEKRETTPKPTTTTENLQIVPEVHSSDDRPNDAGEETPEHAEEEEYGPWSYPNETPRPIHLYPQTDAGCAERVFDRWGDRLLWCPEMRCWLVFDGQRWSEDNFTAEELAVDSIRACLDQTVLDQFSDQSPGNGRPSPQAKWIAYCRQCENQARIESTLKALRRMVPCSVSAFDTERLLLNCKNGVVNLETGTLTPHHPNQRFLKMTPIAYDPKATCPKFKEYLSKIFEGDDETIEFIQTLCGYFATGEVSARLLPIWHGSGSNGKGVLVGILQHVMGPDFVSACPSSLLVERSQNIDPDLADLHGRRLVFQDETEGADVLRIGLVKRLTGGSRIKGARKFQNSFEFESTAKVLILTNSRPRIPEQGHAIWTRICLVPFGVQFWDPLKNESGEPGFQVIENFDRLLVRDEGAGILAWIVAGAQRYKSHGLRQSQKCLAAKGSYKSEQNMIIQFLGDVASYYDTSISLEEAAERGIFVTFKNLYREYCEWAGKNAMGRTLFSERLKESGFQVVEQKRIDTIKYRNLIPGIKIVKAAIEVSLDLLPEVVHCKLPNSN